MIVFIAAVGANNELGRADGKPLWHLPDEYNRFRAMIKNHPIIMGRKSFDVIEHPLEDSLNIIITHQKNYHPKGAIVVNTLEDAIQKAGSSSEIYVIGGGDIFTLALPFASRMEISRIDSTFPDANAFFPEFPLRDWTLISSQKHEKDQHHAFSFTYQTWVRKLGTGVK